jgi:hypothetical protein
MKLDMLQHLQPLAVASAALSSVALALPASASAVEPVAISRAAADRIVALAEATAAQTKDTARPLAEWGESSMLMKNRTASRQQDDKLDGSFEDLLTHVAKT